MEIKESISYGENLITGRKTKKIKKKILMPFQGIATVKLYDDLTGKQIYEAKSENRISAMFSNIAYVDNYYNPILYNKHDNLLKSIFNTYPFRVLALTNGEVEEDPYDYFTWGNLIGCADAYYGYSGSSGTMGTINLAETTFSYENGKGTKHFVFDFPTHAANGTFNSIYWTSGMYDDDSAQYPRLNYIRLKRQILYTGNELPEYSLATDESDLYLLQPDSTECLVYDKFTIERKSDLVLPVSARGLCYDGTDFWILKSNGSFSKLDKNFNVIADYDKSVSVPMGVQYKINYWDIEADEDSIYITYNGSTIYTTDEDYYKSFIAKYNKDGTFVNQIEIGVLKYSSHITKIPTGKFMVTVRYRKSFIITKDLKIEQNTSLCNTDLKSICWDDDTKTIFAHWNSGDGRIYECNVIPASAHTLLPEPITKTPTNTMKIQYDFTCDYASPLEMPAH